MSTLTIKLEMNVNVFVSLAKLLISVLTIVSHAIESVMFRLVAWYDLYMYTPLQVYLSPHMARIPRCIRIGEKTVTVFTANIVTYSRTLLIVPIAWLLKYDYPILACLLVLLHDFLDHVDGIVAKVQKRIYGEGIDDPLLGGFMDAFCDKIVNVFCLWTIIQDTHFGQTSLTIAIGFVLLCYTIIGLETAIGVVRVQDYFRAVETRNKAPSQNAQSSGSGATMAAMEGKLKEKLESMGLAFLCLSTGHLAPFQHWSGIAGIVCFALTVRLAYASLAKKLRAREALEPVRERKKTVVDSKSTSVSSSPSSVNRTIGVINAIKTSTETIARGRAMTLDSSTREKAKQERERLNTPPSLSPSPTGSTSSINNIRTPPILPKGTQNPLIPQMNGIREEDEDRRSINSSSDDQDEAPITIQRSSSLPAIWIDGRADKVYTIGCFDLFHEGHRLLLQRMRQFGREVIVGVHDSRSIHKLKSRVPIDGTETRMLNVKRYADQVYCVAATDPSSFVTCIVHLKENESALYVRGDDMADFPSRHVVEELMPVRFLPYTNGVSSTQLRQELFSHVAANDIGHLEKVN